MNEFNVFNDRTPTEEKSVVTENYPPQITEPILPPTPAASAQSQISAAKTDNFAELTPDSENDFDRDLAVSDRRQRFANEILRLALIGIALVGFVLLNFLFGASDKAPEAFATAKKTLANSDFRFYIFSALYLFGFCAGLALLQRYFAADANAFHLKYLRLQEKARTVLRPTESANNFIPHAKRGFFDGFWLYLFGAETDDLQHQIENERDARDFLFKISGWLLFLSGLLFWLGALSLVLAFGVVFRQFGT